MTTRRTKPGEKLAKAKLWCDLHRNILPPHTKVSLMYPETLYAFLESMGVRWSVARKDWYLRGGSLDPVRSRRGTAQKTIDNRRPVSIRITADKRDIAGIVSEFCELALALDWETTVNDRLYENLDGETVRQYITVRKNRR